MQYSTQHTLQYMLSTLMQRKLNFKYKKKLYMVIVVFMYISEVYCEYTGLDTRSCTGREQKRILNNMPACQVRDTVVDLRPIFSNRSNVVEVIPSHAVVGRCGGGCNLPHHTCQPRTSVLTKMEVMLVLDVWPQGEHEVVCSQAWVQEDQDCTCDCRIRAEHCLPDVQQYNAQACRCVCTNVEERTACLERDMIWDPYSCSCSCPRHTLQHCSTGYVFDLSKSCRCIQISLIASEGMLAAIIVIISIIVLTVLTGILMYRTQTGVFRRERKIGGMETDSTQNARTRLMTQQSRSEFDLFVGNSKRTLKEFDETKLAGILEEK